MEAVRTATAKIEERQREIVKSQAATEPTGIACGGWYFPLFIYQTLSYARGFDIIRWLSSSLWAWIFFIMIAIFPDRA